MCVIGQILGSRLYTAYCKGAPEKIIQSCLKETSNCKNQYVTCLIQHYITRFLFSSIEYLFYFGRIRFIGISSIGAGLQAFAEKN